MRLTQLQDEIDRGAYRIDHHAVAEAIIRRLISERQLAASPPPQDECS